MKVLALMPILFFAVNVFAQSQDREEDANHQEIKENQIEQEKEGHKFFLNSDGPVKEIKDVEHSDDHTPIRSKLSPDGEQVIMYNYKGKGGINLTVVHEDGTESKMTKTPCDVFEDIIL